jgi:quercetin dioxygenase-like cupin family protein
MRFAMEKGNFSKPTRTVDLSGMGTVDVVGMGDMTVSRMTFRPGWRWSEHARPVVGGDSCQTFHHGFVTSGRLMVRMNDGSQEEFAAGDIWIIQPGHDAWVIGDEPVVALEFTPAVANH